MTRKPAFLMTVAIVLLLSPCPEARGREGSSGKDADVESCSGKVGAGIRTDRLSIRQLRVWRRIERIVFARDSAGRFLHPILQSLWRRVESSGHRIFIELRGTGPGNLAGKFVVERMDPEGKNHTLSIRLYLSSIDNASTTNGARREDGFVPFKRLYRERRYAETLGHEMVHAIRILQDPCYATLVVEQRRLEAELAQQSRKTGKVLFEGENELLLRRLDVAAQLVEEPANAMEVAIWRELEMGLRQHMR